MAVQFTNPCHGSNPSIGATPDCDATDPVLEAVLAVSCTRLFDERLGEIARRDAQLATPERQGCSFVVDIVEMNRPGEIVKVVELPAPPHEESQEGRISVRHDHAPSGLGAFGPIERYPGGPQRRC